MSFPSLKDQQPPLDTVYRYTVFNEKPVYGIFLHTYCIKQNGISNNFVIHFKT